jgi:hypothetical protein
VETEEGNEADMPSDLDKPQTEGIRDMYTGFFHRFMTDHLGDVGSFRYSAGLINRLTGAIWFFARFQERTLHCRV